jgi:hypothetical protein
MRLSRIAAWTAGALARAALVARALAACLLTEARLRARELVELPVEALHALPATGRVRVRTLRFAGLVALDVALLLEEPPGGAQ